ncbi:MAG TPA: shikimate kinase [Saprospiraceae bacterium]|nr:shikimate kinase [Saprospiraceae bacterium]HNL37595.1 shikimate kinase [Saprospiraceae bacterium]
MSSGIYLIGFMGSGKSFWGRRLAARLGRPFVDLDASIAAEAGTDIPRIFAEKGEPFFRNTEAECLRKIDPQTGPVVATGGGTPCFFDNMDWMNRHGLTIFLDAPLALLVSRLQSDPAPRPLLTGLDRDALFDFVKTRLVARRLFYRQAQVIFSGQQEEGFDLILEEAVRLFEKQRD